MHYARPWPLYKLHFQSKCKVCFCITYCLQVFIFLIFAYRVDFHLTSHSLSLSFLFRVLGKQLLLPKDEGFQHFQSRSDSVDMKCLPGLHECTSNIKEYVFFFFKSFLFGLPLQKYVQMLLLYY